MTINEKLDEKLEAAAVETVKETLKVSKTLNLAPSPSTELTRLNNTIEQLYDQKRQALQDLKAKHLTERVQMVNDYAKRKDDLQHAESEEIRMLEEKHRNELMPLQELLQRIEGMR